MNTIPNLQHIVDTEFMPQLNQAIATSTEVNSFAQKAVDLIRERLDLYYVGLFLVDSTKQQAHLIAGTGEVVCRCVLNKA